MSEYWQLTPAQVESLEIPIDEIFYEVLTMEQLARLRGFEVHTLKHVIELDREWFIKTVGADITIQIEVALKRLNHGLRSAVRCETCKSRFILGHGALLLLRHRICFNCILLAMDTEPYATQFAIIFDKFKEERTK